MEDLRLRGDALTSIKDQLSNQQSVVLTGPAGIGKSWVAREIASSLDASWHVEHLSGSPAIQGLAFSGVGHLLPQDTVPAVELLVSAVLQAISTRADGRRVLLLLDDFDQLDVGSVAVCHQFQSQGGLILATVRSERIETPSVVALLGRNGVSRHEMAPLDQREVDALLDRELDGTPSPSLANMIWQLSSGNPYVVLSILAEIESANLMVKQEPYWDADLTALDFDKLDSFLGVRLASLSERARHALDLVAIAEPLDEDLAIELGVMPELAGLEYARLVRAEMVAGASQIRPAHPLIGERLRSEIQPLRRRELVGELASSIAIRPEGSFSPGLVRVAMWAQEVGVELPPKLADQAVLAAFATFDLHATSILVDAIPTELRSIEVSVAEALTAALMGDPEQSERVFQRARHAATTELEMTRVITARAEHLIFTGQTAVVLPELEEALEDVTTLEARARLASALAIAGGTQGDFSFAMGVVDELLEHQGLPPDIETGLLFANLIASSLLGPRRDLSERKMRLDTLISSAPSGTGAEMMRIARSQLAITQAEVGWAIAMLDGAADAMDMEGRPSGTLTMGRSIVRMMAWRDDGRVDYAQKGVALLSQSDPGGIIRVGIACYAHALATIGQVAKAREVLKGSDAKLSLADPRSATFYMRAQSQIAASSGDYEKAASINLDACTRAMENDHHLYGAMAAHEAARIGHADMVMDTFDQLVLETEDCPYVVLLTRHCRGVVDGDVSALQDVSADMLSAGLRASAVSALLFASVAARSDDEQFANRLALQAHDLLEEDRTTIVPEISACTNPLSERERQIAHIASEGSSNREMADELFLSTRTVENHLGRIFKKLGLSSRSELSALFRR